MIKCLRGIRGATVVSEDQSEAILEATRELLEYLIRGNGLNPEEDIVSIFFTTTPDLHAEFPARAARELGWGDLPLMGAVEMDKAGALERCIRVLIHAYTDLDVKEIRHGYLRGAEVLRPDRGGCLEG